MRRARHLLVDDLAADVDQVAVLHAARAGALAVAAGEAAVQVQLRAARRRLAFEHLLDQVDAPARAVELVAQQLVGRAGGGAEAAVHALAQDGLGLCAVGRALEFGGEFGLHLKSSGRAVRGRTRHGGSNSRISALVDALERRAQGIEAARRGAGAVRGHEQRCMAAGERGRFPEPLALAGRHPIPALAAMPFDQRRLLQRKHRRGLRHRQAPQVALPARASNHGSRWSRAASQSLRACASSCRSPPRWRAGGLHRGRRAAQAQPKPALALLMRPAARIERQRLAAPAVEQAQRIGLVAVEDAAWLRPARTGSTFRLTSVISPSTPSEPASTRETS